MAWRGMMAHFKDVGLGRGQTWVALLERMGEGEWDRERERKRWRENLPEPQHTAKLATDLQKACMGCINESGLCVGMHVFIRCRLGCTQA